MTAIALGEMWGPVPCEHPGCSESAWFIWMTESEYDTARTQTELHPISHVFVNKIGTAMCETHLQQAAAPMTESNEGTQ